MRDRRSPGPSRRAALAGLAAGGALVVAGCAPGRPAPGPRDVALPRGPRDLAPPRGSRDLAEEPRGGIGGTGATTGVLGTVTALGSVHVNGVRVATPSGTAESPIGPLAPRPGHVAELLAGPDADGPGLAARRLVLRFALVGPVTAAGADGFAVMGVPVRVEPGVSLAAIGGDRPRPGERVAVSGLWTGGGVVASRLDPAPDAATDHVEGVVEGVVARGGTGAPAGPRIGPLALPGGIDVPSGRFAAVAGRWTGAGLVVDDLAIGRPLLDAGPLARVSVEGYLAPESTPEGRDTPGPGLAIAGLGAAFDPGARVGSLAIGRAVFIGALQEGPAGRAAEDGRSPARLFRVEHGIPLPEGHDARVAALAAIGDGLAPTRGAVETR
ncbi:MAG: DUF5666 domain-containing protein [Azospirillaceae bacterium]